MPAQRTWEQREAGADSHLVRERLVYSAELKPELMASSVSPYLDKATWPLARERLCRLSCCDRHHFHTSSSPAPATLLICCYLSFIPSSRCANSCRYNTQGPSAGAWGAGSRLWGASLTTDRMPFHHLRYPDELLQTNPQRPGS